MYAPTLLIADGDALFLRCLRRVMERRGYIVTACTTMRAAVKSLESTHFTFAIIELRLEDGSGLDLLELLRERTPDTRVVVHTGYGNIATAVAATKLGAQQYLIKPADAHEIEVALRGGDYPLSKDRKFPRPEVLEFRYLLAMYERHGRNMSETARAASMHRRTLQRILRRHGVGPSEQVPPEARTEPRHLRRVLRVWKALLEGSDSIKPPLDCDGTGDHKSDSEAESGSSGTQQNASPVYQEEHVN
ncbi:MAG: response regulator [Pseudomonadota bacterium]